MKLFCSILCAILLIGCSSTRTVIQPITDLVPVPTIKDSLVLKDSTIYRFVEVPWYVPKDSILFRDSIIYKKVSLPFKVWTGSKAIKEGLIKGSFNEYTKQLNLDILYNSIPYTYQDTTSYVTQSKSLMDKITDKIAWIILVIILVGGFILWRKK
jgi:hypothetical protein